MNRGIFRPVLATKRGLVSVLAAALAAGLSLGIAGCGGTAAPAPRPPVRRSRQRPAGWGSSAACFPEQATLESTTQADLST